MKTFFILTIILFSSFTDTHAQLPFTPINPSSSGNLIIPKGINYDIIFSEGDTVINIKGQKTTAKGDHDYNAFMPSDQSETFGKFYTSHETNDSNSIIGDGGGGTVYKIKKENERWKSDG